MSTENAELSPETGEHWREAGIDWITYITAGKQASAQLERTAWEVREEWVDASAKEKPFGLMGYRGVQWPNVRVGRLGARCLVQLSGPVADGAWDRLVSCGGRVSRLDVQTTVSLSRSQPAYGMRFLRRAATTHRRPPQSLPKVGKSRDSSGLFLGTVGRRTAPRYGRCYDKGVELNCAPAGHIWRVEIEAKDTLGVELWKGLTEAKDARRWCWDSCATQWRLLGCCWPLGAYDAGHEPVRAPRRPPSDAVRLAAWMRASVAPVVTRLLRTYSAAQIAGMIGLTSLDGGTDDVAAER